MIKDKCEEKKVPVLIIASGAIYQREKYLIIKSVLGKWYAWLIVSKTGMTYGVSNGTCIY